METQQLTQTRTSVSRAVAISALFLAGIGSAAAFVLFGSSKLDTTSVVLTQNTNTTNANTKKKDLTKQEVPKTESLSAYRIVLPDPDQPPVENPPVSTSIKITSPTEGGIADGGTPVTVALSDPNNTVTNIRLSIYSTIWPDYFGGKAVIGTMPKVSGTTNYTFGVNYALYPSGEVLYVAEGLNAAGQVVIKGDTMSTWARTCYYLAYQDMTTEKTTASVVAGQSVTVAGTVTNKMRGNCKNIYDLRVANGTYDPTLPSGFSYMATPTSLDMGINQTSNFTATIKTSSTTAAGVYNVNVISQRQGTGFIVAKPIAITVTRP